MEKWIKRFILWCNKHFEWLFLLFVTLCIPISIILISNDCVLLAIIFMAFAAAAIYGWLFIIIDLFVRLLNWLVSWAKE